MSFFLSLNIMRTRRRRRKKKRKCRWTCVCVLSRDVYIKTHVIDGPPTVSVKKIIESSKVEDVILSRKLSLSRFCSIVSWSADLFTYLRALNDVYVNHEVEFHCQQCIDNSSVLFERNSEWSIDCPRRREEDFARHLSSNNAREFSLAD